MLSPDIAYFGYGSLVNRQTQPEHTRAIPTYVTGWIRQWKNCADTASYGKICALTVTRSPGIKINGVLILDQSDRIAETDCREVGYRRKEIKIDDATVADKVAGIKSYIYVSTPDCYRWGNAEYPIFQSYLDCVLAGYLEVWKRDGAAQFIATTEGWHVPILDDRAAPRYRPALKISEGIRREIDSLLDEAKISRAR